ncbi:MAG: hypothetical protein IJW40_06475 [Clostridia bacterium]|nr:hypothetical protein [Clostridia bacterium]
MQKNPIRVGVIYALLCHIVTWLTLGIPTYVGAYVDAGLILSLTLLTAHIVLLFCLNRRAHRRADTFKRGLRFSVAFLITAAALLIGETVFVATSQLAWLDPHSGMLPGLGYIVFWAAWLAAFAVDVLLILVQACRARIEQKRLKF